jgi:hypothetical protein
MEAVEAQQGGQQPIETLPNATSMAPSNAAAESSAPGARDEEEADDADDAADGTPGVKRRKPRRPKMEVLAEKVLKAEATVANKQVCCRSMHSQISRTPTAVW